MSEWLITYRYRLHRRQSPDAAIFMDVGGGTKTEITRIDPMTWLEYQNDRWRDLQDRKTTAGEAMTDIVVLFAIERHDRDR
jgi:hypothetical protein